MSTDKQTIETLTRRHQQLDRRKTTAENDLKHAREQLERLQAQASEAYGSDDPKQLAELLAKMKEENETKRADYQQALDKIENKLTEIEDKYNQAPGEK